MEKSVPSAKKKFSNTRYHDNSRYDGDLFYHHDGNEFAYTPFPTRISVWLSRN